MDWKPLLTSTTSSVNEELRLRNAYFMTENRILRHQVQGRMRLTDGERQALATIGKKLGKKTLGEIATIAKAETILAWDRKCVAPKGPGSVQRKAPGRPRVDKHWKPWSCVWPRRITRGAMTALSAPWRIWAIP